MFYFCMDFTVRFSREYLAEDAAVVLKGYQLCDKSRLNSPEELCFQTHQVSTAQKH